MLTLDAAPEAVADVLGALNDVEERHAPRTLYVGGDRTLLRERRVSIVGTRKPSPEGGQRAAKLVGQLVQDGVVIVSGLATGVDTIAHATAIARGGRTIAVLGTPLTEVYPRENAALQAKIIREHLAVSQFAPGTPTTRKNFPQRNRLMALCSDATVIIEAGESSGSWSQAWEALRLGRPLFLLESLAKRTDLVPVKDLLHHGAQALRSTDQLIDELPSSRYWHDVALDF